MLPALLASVLILAGCQSAQDAGASSLFARTPSVAETEEASVKSLVPLFKALQTLEAGKTAGPVVAIQIGDSHTANDAFSGRMRELFQERFGAAGRGLLPPGVPFKHYKPALVTVGQTGPWTFHSSFKPRTPGPFGLTGFRLSSAGPGATLTLESTEPEGIDRFAMEVAPDDGAVPPPEPPEVRFDGQPAAQPSVEGPFRVFAPPAGTRRVQIHAAEGFGADLLSLVMERRRPGVVYENQGIIGATVAVEKRWEADLVHAELAFRKPSLIVVAYGTNEGFNDGLDPQDYATTFDRQVGALAAAAPQAAIVIAGPPDANRYSEGCPGTGKARKACAPLSAEDRANHAARFLDKPTGEACRWHPPPKLSVVREIQRRIATVRGWFFWDWEAAMGGACGIHDWVHRDPPLALDDHVHLRAAGYRLTADALFRELMGRYERYQGRQVSR